MEVLAIIPARGGSKGIKDKNLTEINGKSLVRLSVEHALASAVVTRVVVSSDSAAILAEAEKYGAEALLRPVELAEDQVLDLPVFAHVLDVLAAKEGYQPDFVVHLRPTAPYRQAAWIDQAVQQLAATAEADSVRSVSPPDKHPYRMFTVDAQGFLDPIMKHAHPEPYLLRRQDLPAVYYYNCVVDVTRPATIRAKQSMTGSRILPFMMDADEVIDIDTWNDLLLARTLFKDKI